MRRSCGGQGSKGTGRAGATSANVARKALRALWREGDSASAPSALTLSTSVRTKPLPLLVCIRLCEEEPLDTQGQSHLIRGKHDEHAAFGEESKHVRALTPLPSRAGLAVPSRSGDRRRGRRVSSLVTCTAGDARGIEGTAQYSRVHTAAQLAAAPDVERGREETRRGKPGQLVELTTARATEGERDKRTSEPERVHFGLCDCLALCVPERGRCRGRGGGPSRRRSHGRDARGQRRS
mgnify:CR=1 FL=1